VRSSGNRQLHQLERGGVAVRVLVSIIASLVSVWLLAGTAARADFTADPHQSMRELYRGARATAMGDAFVSIADDEEALFYNPAGLAGITSSTFQFVNMDLETSGDIVDSTTSSYSQYKNLSGDTLNVLMGKDIYLHGNYTPTYVTPNFGMAILTDQQLSLVTQNKALPQVELGFQTTNGVQMGYGFKLGHVRHSRSEVRLGIGVKFLFRRGGYYLLTQRQAANISRDEVEQIVGNYGTGVGFDLGTQYIYHLTRRIQLQAGAAWTEIGGVTFSTDTAEPLPGNLSAGLSVHYNFAHMAAKLAYDMRHINVSTDSRLRNHFGAEFSIPMFHFYTGLNEIYPTFGIGLDFGLVSVTLVSYAEELSTMAGINRERRYLLHLGMGF
jgi:hypothetical protein